MNKALFAIAAGIAVWMFSQKGGSVPKAPPLKDPVKEPLNVLAGELRQWLGGSSFSADIKASISDAISRMSEFEIRTLYKFIFHHIRRGAPVLPGSLLYSDMKDIAMKYGIFSNAFR